MAHLEVDVVGLSECFVSAGQTLKVGEYSALGIHYVLSGVATIQCGVLPKIDVRPHTLVIVPPDTSLQIWSREETVGPLGSTVKEPSFSVREGINTICVGAWEPRTVLICGHFDAHYGSSTGLFQNLTAPIVESFAPMDRIDERLGMAVDELAHQQVGAAAMSATLIKQVLVMLLRRSLTSLSTWAERFSLLRDPQVAQAFALMAADPGAPYTIEVLAQKVFMSRSAFMARFSSVVGLSPMVVLRGLRMRLAAQQLAAGVYSLDQVCSNAGYSSRSSFARAFRKLHGVDPLDYRNPRTKSGRLTH